MDDKTVISLTQMCVGCDADLDTPISLYMRLVNANQGFLLESAEVDGRAGRYSLIGYRFMLRLSCSEGRLVVAVRDARLEPLRRYNGMPFQDGLRAVISALDIQPENEAAGDLPAITRGLYGYLGYGVAGLFESALSHVISADEAEACLVLPGCMALVDHLYNRLYHISLTGHSEVPAAANRSVLDKPVPRPRIGAVASNLTREQYMAAVDAARGDIRRGEAIQTVLSVRHTAPFEGDEFTLYRRLRRINPSPYMFFMRLPEIVLFGSSPEVMVKCTDGRIFVNPIAGTRPRGRDDAEDDRLAAELSADEKERAEHTMLVDLGRNDVGRVSASGSVRVDRLMDVERFSHVMHLTSRVSGTLSAGCDAVDVLAATFPAGTVSGAPKVRAMKMIAEYERTMRGPYSGCIGWIGLACAAVNLDMGIIIRSGWVRDGHLNWQAGAGIVYDSVPEREWVECQNKAAAMRAAIADESMR